MKTVMAIHGAGGGGWEYGGTWKPVFEKRGYRFLAPDLQPTPAGLGRTTLADYVRQIRRRLPRDETPVLVGASMGGIIALKVAEQIKVAAVVLVNSVPPAGVVTAHTPTERFPTVVKWANAPVADTRAAMPDSDEATIQKAAKLWRDESGTVMNELYDRVAVQKPKCRVLVVIGGKDTDISPQTSRNVAAWASADVQEYAGMSHVGPLLSTRADSVARNVVAWLQSQDIK